MDSTDNIRPFKFVSEVNKRLSELESELKIFAIFHEYTSLSGTGIFLVQKIKLDN